MGSTVYIVVGVHSEPAEQKSSGMKMYRVVASNVTKVKPGQYKWGSNCLVMGDNEIITSLKRGDKWLNVKEENGKVVGSTGSLSRFDAKNGIHPFVIVSQIIDSYKRILGYKVVGFDGSIKNISLREMIGYGERISKQKGIPVQNAIFIPQDGDKRGYYKAYPGQKFLVEIIETKANPNAQKPAKVAVQKNQKVLNKINELFTPEQIHQLKLGKSAGVDIRVYANTALSPEQMQELRKGLEIKVNVRPFASPEYSAQLMKGYVLDSKAGLNIKTYLNPKYTIEQLFEVGLAVEKGLDISELSDVKNSATEMAEIRQRLEAGIWKTIVSAKRREWL